MSYFYRLGSQLRGCRGIGSLRFFLPGLVIGLSPIALADSSRQGLEHDLPPSSLIAQSSAAGELSSRQMASVVQSVRLNSSAAMVVDQVSGQVLIEKNADAELHSLDIHCPDKAREPTRIASTKGLCCSILTRHECQVQQFATREPCTNGES